MNRDDVRIQFWKKIDVADQSEPCDECMAKPVCRLRDQLHKLKVEGKDKTIIESCDLMVS